MVVIWDEVCVVNVTVDGQRIEQVKNLKYVSSIITEMEEAMSKIEAIVV